MTTMVQPEPGIGGLIQHWRKRRRLSQLDLALDAGISQRHLSFIESGRSTPSRDMVLRLAEHLAVPARQRNTLLTAAGYAPAFRERKLDEPGLAAARRTVDLILSGHAPHPALALDRHWNLVAANAVVAPLMASAAPALREPPVNVLRLSLHPDGLSRSIINIREWRAHVLARLGQQIEASGDPVLAALRDELKAYPVPAGATFQAARDDLAGIAVPFRLASPLGTLSFLSTTTVFGTAVDITLAELTIETFFPADEETSEAMRKLAEA